VYVGAEKDNGVRLGIVSRSLAALDDHANPMIRDLSRMGSIADLHQIASLKLAHQKGLLSLIGEHSHTSGFMITGLPVWYLARFT
jgi:hypothetical protein